jgi:hypothetical protein
MGVWMVEPFEGPARQLALEIAPARSVWPLAGRSR